ncbi:nickel pincer cofactor biosynthesis protein LarC [Microaerobacter geothermalis]|uniref:nickel pincer cofactor biosynthesis protein LarC n=1 Tax=Microaerobacter geothermalis TaxID=674972 RepID=UPI001F1B6D08|nr:nickel pincer cofactor biosynthesis protein LarC [Microaerobacter geothermalis]MCF6092403.1 nickel pincer cofactor biosynthesis protein LarC [Microaerobacter geothermalis]
MSVLYLDCFSGISGNMALAALVDAGADPHQLEKDLKQLPIEPFSLHWERVLKRGVTALHLTVKTDENIPSKSHRHYHQIETMIKEAHYSDQVKEWAISIFRPIAVAEAKIHHTTVEKVHFHEVGAVDSIVDIVGFALALEQLNISEIYSSPIPVGGGFVECAHGTYPVPAPATLEILKGIPLSPSSIQGEMTTPTGAGIIAGLSKSSGPLVPMVVEHIGYGAGTKDFPDQPNVLRAILGFCQS